VLRRITLTPNTERDRNLFALLHSLAAVESIFKNAVNFVASVAPQDAGATFGQYLNIAR
jgi:hypothetical protein